MILPAFEPSLIHSFRLRADPWPAAVVFFDREWKNVRDQIKSHAGYADFVPVDVASLTPAQQQIVRQHVESLGDPSVYVVGL